LPLAAEVEGAQSHGTSLDEPVRGKGLAAEQRELAFPRGIDPFANIRPYPAFKDRYKDG
jgi:hypothetical protein